MICLEHKLFWVFWHKSFIMIREIKIRVLFEIWMKLTSFFQNLCCQVGVTQLDIESKYSIKKPFSCNCTAAPGCARYLPMNFSTFWSPNCPVCKEMSPFWPILCEKVIFRTGFWYSIWNWVNDGLHLERGCEIRVYVINLCYTWESANWKW